MTAIDDLNERIKTTQQNLKDYKKKLKAIESWSEEERNEDRRVWELAYTGLEEGLAEEQRNLGRLLRKRRALSKTADKRPNE